MIISIEMENSFDKIKHPFIIKVLDRLGMQGTYLNKIKTVYSELIPSISLNVENRKAIPLKSGTL